MRSVQTKLVPPVEIGIEHRQVIESFKNDFESIRSKGFVPSNRRHNTGIGKTFEDLIGIVENNHRFADYKGIIELKSTRDYSSSLVTLFTDSPTHPSKANNLIKEKFGYPDKHFPDTIVIHTTIPALNFNDCKNKYGFRLVLDDEEEKIFIEVKDLESDQLVDLEVYYTYDALKKIVEKKCKYIAYINAEKKEIDGKEHFHFKNAVLLTGLTFDGFISAIKNGDILYDIRIGCYKSGPNIGKPHDHGSGMRVRKNKINNVFNVEVI